MCYSAAHLRAWHCTRYNNGRKDLCPCTQEKKDPSLSCISYGVIIAPIQGGGIIFSDVTLYICECNDSCGLHVERLPKVQTSQVASLRNAAGVVEQSSALLVPHQK